MKEPKVNVNVQFEDTLSKADRRINGTESRR